MYAVRECCLMRLADHCTPEAFDYQVARPRTVVVGCTLPVIVCCSFDVFLPTPNWNARYSTHVDGFFTYMICKNLESRLIRLDNLPPAKCSDAQGDFLAWQLLTCLLG